ncbi:hypothetical protein GF386_00055 [Candidatus Pacearchaeota archaeon]|nr:hypothetical protein [Candidatus Pacearchaeota archaeon]MBD3282671.1 hypothetical protein [Candidatus Pacearchaeota archaeon]
MKHSIKVTAILITVFLITQLIGIAVISYYNISENALPYGMEPPSEIRPKPFDLPFQILLSFLIAISLFFILTQIKAEGFIRFWFFAVTILALGISLNVVFSSVDFIYSSIIAFIVAIPFAFVKIYKRNILVHNLTELLIYPGIAAVFVPILNILGIIILLLIISLYDIWAVWYSEFMQKMANYQINNLKFFTGFFIPYASKKEKQKIKKIKQKYEKKSKKDLENKFKKAKIKVNLAILGGGDIIFPIITAGVFIKVFNSIIPGLVISLFSTIALFTLFFLARKGKFYPAMPFLTIGIYLAMIFNWLFVV